MSDPDDLSWDDYELVVHGYSEEEKPMPMIDPNNAAHIQALIENVDEMFNEGYATKKIGVIMLTFPYNASDGQANYISNGANRKDIIAFLEETAKRLRAREDSVRLPYLEINIPGALDAVGVLWLNYLRQLGVSWEGMGFNDDTTARLNNVSHPRDIALPTWATHPPVEGNDNG